MQPVAVIENRALQVTKFTQQPEQHWHETLPNVLPEHMRNKRPYFLQIYFKLTENFLLE